MFDYLDLAIRILFQQLLYISDTLSSLKNDYLSLRDKTF